MKLIILGLFLSSCSMIKKVTDTNKLRQKYLETYQYKKNHQQLKRDLQNYFSFWHSEAPGYQKSGDKMTRLIYANGYIYNNNYKNDFNSNVHILEESNKKIMILNSGIIYKVESISNEKSALKIYPIVKYNHPQFSDEKNESKKNGWSIDKSYFNQFKTNGKPVNIDELLVNGKRSFTHEWYVLNSLDKKGSQELSSKIDNDLLSAKE